MINKIIFKELMKRGYSLEGAKKTWNIADSKLWYLTPELSEGFLNFSKYEPYRKNVVDKETQMIRENSDKIKEMACGEPFNLIDLGCGNGTKAEVLINSLPDSIKLRYCPVDISSDFIERATARIKALKNIEVESSVSDFEDVREVIGLLRNNDFQKNLVLLLGETLSHYDIHEILYKISEGMFDADMIIIGNGFREEKERFVNLEKYKDPLFNEWFIHILRGLGFNDEEVEYDARFKNNRLEFFYKIKVDKSIEESGMRVKFSAGDEIVIGMQYKYFEDELTEFCKMYFCDVDMIKDPAGYCLILCKK